MKVKQFVICIAFIICNINLIAQTGIGTTTPNVSAKLEVAATDKGFLLPRMTATQRGAIASPATGLLVYQTDAPTGFFVNTGSSGTPNWLRISNDWIKSGNDISYTTGNVSTTGNLTGGNSNSSSISGFAANINTQTGVTYTIDATDNGKVIQTTNANPISISINTGLPNGFNCTIVQMGAGQVTFSGSATRLNRTGFTKSASQYSVVSILHLGSNNILVTGEMSN